MTPLEAKYQGLLLANPQVQEVRHRHIAVPYQDGFTGEHGQYSPSFTISYKDGRVEHVEVLPASKQMPLTQLLYAQNNLEGWRMISKQELLAIDEQDCEVPAWW